MTIAVTGADGFIGTAFCVAVESRGRQVARIVRRAEGPGGDRRVISDLSGPESLDRVLDGVDVVVHLAARAHVLRETEADPQAAFQRANVDATVRLAEAAVHAGVRRFVYVSSIGVSGNETREAPFTESQSPAPVEPYANSKLQAELALMSIAERSGLQFVIVRPSMVYGPGVKGNFLRMMSLVESGAPLPLASLTNRRSLIGVENLNDLLILCTENVSAANELFLAAEADVHSTPGLMQAIAKAMGRPSRLFRFPPKALQNSARIAGLEDHFIKSCGSLEVNAAKVRQILGWKPRQSFEHGILRTVAWFRERGRVAA